MHNAPWRDWYEQRFCVVLHDVVVAEKNCYGGPVIDRKMNISQQILALDARYNAYRVPNNPSYREYHLSVTRR